MTMTVGDRVTKGKIKRREEAQAIYEAAREAGQTASLLDQERPNIFTQSVADIAPGAEAELIDFLLKQVRRNATLAASLGTRDSGAQSGQEAY